MVGSFQERRFFKFLEVLVCGLKCGSFEAIFFIGFELSGFR